MVNFPGQVLLFLPLVQMSTMEPIMWFICPSLDAILGGDQGINPRLRILDLAVVICLLPLLFTFALSRITIGQWETLSYIPETDSIFFGSMLLPTIVKVVSKLMEWFISQVRSRSLLKRRFNT